MERKSRAAVLLIVVLAAGFAVSGAISRAQSGGITREVLVTGEPAAAPGQLLQLQRIEIEPHTQLPVHTHPGMQAAWISEGTLTYFVVHGEAIVTRAPINGTPTPAETLTDGGTTELHPGDSIVETEGLIHYAENQADEPIELFIASLLADGRPGTEVVDISATPVG
jgi:quercetin dioxygenase-like cupin family protein